MSVERKKIAIIGSGIAGLSAAWLLGRYHDITLFERHERPGMGAFNLTHKDGNIEERIDVPLRAFNTCYYKNLVALYAEMGVEIHRTDHSASYSSEDNQNTYFGYQYFNVGKRALPFIGNLKGLNFKTLTIVKDMARFLFFAKRDCKKGEVDGFTIEQYLRSNHYSSAFIDEVILPSFAAICTCSYDAVRQYPAEIIIEFLADGMLFNGIWRAKHGAEDAIDKMLQHCDKILCQVEVKKIRKNKAGVQIVEKNGKLHQFDHAIIAVQANQAVNLISEDEAHATELLNKVPYERSEVVVHSDIKLIPNADKNRAPVNFLVDKEEDKPMASIWLNKIYPSLKNSSPLFQTWNPTIAPDETMVLGRAHFERPIVNLKSLSAIKSLNRLHHQRDRKIWYCGSYAMPGIPLLESAVQSAMSISEHLGVDVPWR
jgi:predicted NAD/FAD-binding protein